MQAFIKTDLFKQLNVGFALDEGRTYIATFYDINIFGFYYCFLMILIFFLRSSKSACSICHI